MTEAQAKIITPVWARAELPPRPQIQRKAVNKMTHWQTRFNVSFGDPITLSTRSSASEPTIGYWGDSLIVLIRRNEYNMQYNLTNNPEGDSGWFSNSIAVTGLHLYHAPALLPYWNGNLLPFACAKYFAANNRKTVFGYIKRTDNTLIVEYFNLLHDWAFGYGGYCGLTWYGGNEFGIVYYTESAKSADILGAQTGLYYERINSRVLISAMAYESA